MEVSRQRQLHMFQIDLIPIFKRHLNEGAPQVQIIKHPLKVQTIVLKYIYTKIILKREREMSNYSICNTIQELPKKLAIR